VAFAGGACFDAIACGGDRHLGGAPFAALFVCADTPQNEIPSQQVGLERRVLWEMSGKRYSWGDLKGLVELVLIVGIVGIPGWTVIVATPLFAEPRDLWAD